MTEQKIPEQPDGITDDSFDLPDPARAPERVNEWLAWFGDGVVNVEGGGVPLYARDLQALANLATRPSCEDSRAVDETAEDRPGHRGDPVRRAQLAEERLAEVTEWCKQARANAAQSVQIIDQIRAVLAEIDAIHPLDFKGIPSLGSVLDRIRAILDSAPAAEPDTTDRWAHLRNTCPHGLIRGLLTCPVCEPEAQAAAEASARAFADRADASREASTDGENP